jgi:hypothetical protein
MSSEIAAEIIGVFLRAGRSQPYYTIASKGWGGRNRCSFLQVLTLVIL